MTAPNGWHFQFPRVVKLPPGERVELALTIHPPTEPASPVETVRITGDFGPAGKPTLALRIMPEPRPAAAGAGQAIPDADRPDRWSAEASGGSKLQVAQDGKALVWTARLGSGDRWVYPRMDLAEGERPPADAIGVQATITLLEGEGTFRAVVREANGSGYACDFEPRPERGKTVETVALFETGSHGDGWSAPDPNQRLDADQVRSLAIGCNTPGDQLKYRIENVRWLRRK